MSAPTLQQTAAENEGWMATRPLMRVVNFHNTPKSNTEQIDRQLAGYAKSFSSVNEQELRDYLITGVWKKSKPGLIPVAYEGYRNGYDVFAPLLEKHGFIGWYFIITEFIKAAPEDQEAFAKAHHINMQTREYADGRYALSWEEIRTLDKRHVIASHARTHSELSTLEAPLRDWEVTGSQEDFRRHLGHPVKGFASLRGPAAGDHPVNDPVIAAAGYEFVFSNYRIQRIGRGDKHAG